MDYQEKLLKHALSKYPLSPEVISAYKKSPRHQFIKRPYSMEEMYGDYPLAIYEDDEFISTISQPSFVLLMIDMLDLKSDHKVLELGAGSGWNAALMSYIAKEVVSVEIIPSLAEETRENLKSMGFPNVKIITGDGADGYLPDAPYDRGIFTAGATDLPRAFHEQISVGGKLLFVLKQWDVDLLLLLEKKMDHFAEISRLHCSFVPMKGKSSAMINRQIETGGRIKIYLNTNEEGGFQSLFLLA
jgi:protein-L-isoaspartate(D-aspartate) O-methyltransferase